MPAAVEAPVMAPVSAPNPSLQPKIDIHAPLFPENILIPRAYERREITTPSNVARHETLHWMVGGFLGASVDEASVIPADGSLGRVTFSGTLDPIKFQIIAAASSVEFGDYKPKGTGGDHGQIEIIARRGGHSKDRAVGLASSILSHMTVGFGPELIDRVAVILEEKGSIKGSVDRVLAQAKYELLMERSAPEGEVNMVFAHQRKLEEARRLEISEKEPDKPKRTTIIDTMPNDISRVRIMEGKKIIEEETFCSMCGARGGGHTEQCVHAGTQLNRQSGTQCTW